MVNDMKQVKISDLKKAINGNTNDIVILAMYGLKAQCDHAKDKGYNKLYRRYNKEWNILLDLLDSVGYFDN